MDNLSNQPELKEQPIYVISYMQLRKLLGYLGLTLPFILMIGGFISTYSWKIQPSISDYYATKMGDVFVGVLVAIGLFLITYRFESEKARKDNMAGNFAGFFAFGVALFPNSSSSQIVSTIHFISALLLFSILAYFCLKLFTLTGHPKKRRLYRYCGWIIIACLVILGIYFVLTKVGPKIDWSAYSFVFWWESVALGAFGLSWLVKGEGILKGLAKE